MQLRNRLVPYIYSEAYRYYDAGINIVKPLYHIRRELYYDSFYKNEYLFGSQLLISPLTDKKDQLMNRVVHKFFLPEGMWYDFNNGKNIQEEEVTYHSLKMKIIQYLQEVAQ